MARGDHQMRIRLPGDLLELVETAAKASGRSMNAEIVQRLTGSFGPQLPPVQLADYGAFREMIEAIEKGGPDAVRVEFKVFLSKPEHRPDDDPA